MMIFDIVLIEKEAELGNGLTKQEVKKMLTYFDKDVNLLPVEYDGVNSTAMGFMTSDTEERLYSNYDPDELKEFIYNILADMENELPDDTYAFYEINIYLTRNIL